MKIFGIGLSKTGTTSLAVALETLGFNARHAVSSLDEIDDVDAVTDEMATIYQRLDEEYPGSKFILTVRDEASWLRSCRHHFRQPVPADHPIHDVLMALYGTTVFEREKFLAGYRRHSEAVREYFRGRPDDLLVLDLVSGGEGYRELCAFLECPMPDAAEFPKENVSRSWRRIWRKLRRTLGLATP
ncbi:MAG: hypothetical protein KDA63_07310 [Planctomycetales bacterium]|nr:hypothetical protein [Planctomycetales bacterium]